MAKMALIMLFLLAGFKGYSNVTVTPASGGTNICSTVATSPTTLGNITVTEGTTGDFSTPSGSITLVPPAGWQFAGITGGVSTSGGDVSFSGGVLNPSSLTLNFNVSGTSAIDIVTISGLQIQATSTGSAAGDITASSNFGIAGITTGSGGTDFGDLSITTAVTPSVTISASPSSTICAGTNVTFTPSAVNGGATPSFQWFVNGSPVGSGAFFSTSTLSNGNTVNAIMTVSGGFCATSGTASSNTISMVVNPVPATTVVSGAGTFCGSTTITASNGGSGTMYFQGTTSNGTSTATPSSSQLVTTSGTYYFRAQWVGGCWGTQGSAVVTINTAPTANAGAPQSVCAGGTITLGGSIGGSATSATWTAPSGTFSNASSLTSNYTPSIASGTVTLTLTTNDPDGAGPCTGAISTVVITVNALPNPVIVSGGGTFCGSTTLTAANGGSGTIYFQGTTSGGTSTATPSSSQLVNTSGTYFFRAQSAAGCWGTEGSAAVTINPGATANAGLPQSVCAGGTITLAGSIGGSATSSTWSAPSGSFSNVSSLTSTYTPTAVSGTVTLTLTTNDPDGAGPCTPATSTVVITINPLPNAPGILGAGTFCGSTNLTATLVGPGTIFFQGNTPGGTSTVLGGTPQTITSSGTYFFRAQSAAGCWGPDNSASVTINPLPVAYNIVGGGSYCIGGTGVDIALSSSDAGINYRLFRGGTGLGIQPGTGAALDFGLQTGAGTYTILASNATTSCTVSMSGTATVAINPLPTAFTVSGSGSYCAGGTGVNVNLSGSAIGVNYQLLLGGLPSGAAIAGTGGGFTFGPQTAAGTYTAQATNTLTGCVNNMLGSATITINTLPTAFSVTGGGGYCAGGLGAPVGLATSTVGVNYSLMRGITLITTMAGTGSALNFGNQTGAGTYTVVATNTTTSCTNTMTGSATVTINALPGLFTVTGGGSYCSGGIGVNVGLTGSAVGVNYQLFNGATPVGTSVAGTGSALNFGLQTAAGTYTVQATDATTLCSSNMTGSATVTVTTLPTAFSVVGGGSYCLGGAGVDVSISGSQVGVDYQLYNTFVPVGAPVPGTGGIISFGNQTAAGFYTVTGTNTTTTCVNNMTGGVAVTILPLPTAYTMTGGGSFCTGGAGVHVGLSNSDVGVMYQLFNGVTPVGAPVAGVGGPLDFGLQTSGGTYTVVATDASTACVNDMAGIATVVVNLLPNTYFVGGGGNYCAGGPGVDVNLVGSDVGVDYQLFVDGVPTGSPVAGTGGFLDFGLQTAAGTYTVIGTDAGTSCTNNMIGSAIVGIDPLPTVYSLTGGGSFCVGGAGLSVGLSGSDVGVDYQLFIDGIPAGSAMSGTGLPLDFGTQTTAGTYSVVATNTTTLCTNNMAPTVNIVINPLPTVYNLTGGGPYCTGGSGSDIQLSGSDVGVDYQLSVGGSPVGSPMPGTGSLIDFGLQTSVGSYSAVATDATTGCSSNMTSSVTVSIVPLPAAYVISGGGTYCAGGTGFDITLSSSDAGVTYQLFNGTAPVGGSLAGTGSLLDFGFFTAAGPYTIVATDIVTGCSANMLGTALIIISPFPAVAPIAGSTVLCTGATTSLSDLTSGGVWSSSSTSIATVSSAGVVSGVSAGATTISYTVTNGAGCATSVSIGEVVLAGPTVSAITGPTTVCGGLAITLADTTAGGTWSSSNVAFATVGSSSGVVTGIATGSVTISYSVTNTSGCTTRVFYPVTVGAAMPTAAIVPAGSATICHESPVTLSVLTSDSTGITYQWSVAGGAIAGATNSWYIATTPGIYTATIDNGTCSEILSGTNVVTSTVPVITYDTAASLLITGTYTTYQWYKNGAAIPGATSNTTTYGTNGDVFIVVVSDGNGCTDTSAAYIVPGNVKVVDQHMSADVKIYPNPVSSILHIDAPVKVFVSVSSLDGKVLMERREAISLNVNDLAPGMYMITVYDENDVLLKTDRFVKVQ